MGYYLVLDGFFCFFRKKIYLVAIKIAKVGEIMAFLGVKKANLIKESYKYC